MLAGSLYAAGVLSNMTGNVSYHAPIGALLLVNALIARFTDTTTIYVVPTPSKPRDKDSQHSEASDATAAKQD